MADPEGIALARVAALSRSASSRGQVRFRFSRTALLHGPSEGMPILAGLWKERERASADSSCSAIAAITAGGSSAANLSADGSRSPRTIRSSIRSTAMRGASIAATSLPQTPSTRREGAVSPLTAAPYPSSVSASACPADPLALRLFGGTRQRGRVDASEPGRRLLKGRKVEHPRVNMQKRHEPSVVGLHELAREHAPSQAGAFGSRTARMRACFQALAEVIPQQYKAFNDAPVARDQGQGGE